MVFMRVTGLTGSRFFASAAARSSALPRSSSCSSGVSSSGSPSFRRRSFLQRLGAALSVPRAPHAWSRARC
jgi:hypothetical protein